MPIDGQRPHVVVIDHAPEILLLFEELLASEAYRATVLGTCPESAEQLVALRPDVVLHDYTLTHAEADLESLRRITTDPRTSHIPLVVCSAAVDIEEIAGQLGGASVRVVRKPFTLDDVLDTLRECSERRLPHPTRDAHPPDWRAQT